MAFDPVISLRQWQAAITSYLKVFFHIPFKDQYQLLQERGETENQSLVCGLVCPEQNPRQEAKHIKTCETSVPDREKAQRKCTECQREAQSFRQGNRGKHTHTDTHPGQATVPSNPVVQSCTAIYCGQQSVHSGSRVISVNIY